MFWPTFIFWSISSYTGAQAPYFSFQWSKWAGGKKSKKKPSVLINFRFLVNFIRHTGPMVIMVTRCTGSLSQLPVVKMSWGKKSKKKPSVLTNFYFLVNFIRHIGPMVTMVTRYICGLSLLPVVKMSWKKNSKKKPSVLTNFHFLVNFVTHTHWSHGHYGHQAHRWAISASSGQNKLGNKF